MVFHNILGKFTYSIVHYIIFTTALITGTISKCLKYHIYTKSMFDIYGAEITLCELICVKLDRFISWKLYSNIWTIIAVSFRLEITHSFKFPIPFMYNIKIKYILLFIDTLLMISIRTIRTTYKEVVLNHNTKIIENIFDIL